LEKNDHDAGSGLLEHSFSWNVHCHLYQHHHVAQLHP